MYQTVPTWERFALVLLEPVAIVMVSVSVLWSVYTCWEMWSDQRNRPRL